jgi:hypothetical protein
VAIDTLDVTGLYLFPAPASLTITPAGAMLRIDAPAAFDVRRGPLPTSELVRRIGS